MNHFSLVFKWYIEKDLDCTLLIGLFSSEKYWRVAKHLVFILKEVIQVTFYFYEILMKIQRKK